MKSEHSLWFFTYGALMWDPAFEFVERVPAVLTGYSRQFCIQSKTWRGTPEKPGLVAGLVPGGHCNGFAYRIDEAKREKALRDADECELIRDVYYRVEVPIILSDERIVLAQAYVTNLLSKEYRDYTLTERADIIRTAIGPEGSNLDYVRESRERLLALGIQDPAVEEIFLLL